MLNKSLLFDFANISISANNLVKIIVGHSKLNLGQLRGIFFYNNKVILIFIL